jgi:predicted RND superfamily exporter protein
MWFRLADALLKYRLPLLLLLLGITLLMGYWAGQVKLSYQFSRAIPENNPVYQEYQRFRQQFGDDGNRMVVGVQSDSLFTPARFNAYARMQRELRQVSDVQEVIGIPGSIRLLKNEETQQTLAEPIFPDTLQSRDQLDSCRRFFSDIRFYKNRLYNPVTGAALMAVTINKDSLNSAKRTSIINQVIEVTQRFESATGIKTHLSGLPLIRTQVSNRIQQEMRFFLLGSLLLSALILLIFFRSVGTMLLSLAVVLIGVVWSMGLMRLFHYDITLLTALIPPLIVVIGIPNCIYFINKYHSSLAEGKSVPGQRASEDPTAFKLNAIRQMVGKMGVVTLFCNITAAIGFAVFALTRSNLLREFGLVSGIGILLVFFISVVLIPAVLSYLPLPGKKQMRYLDNRFITSLLLRIERWVMHHQRAVYLVTALVVLLSVAGMFRLKTEAFIVDDLPKNDPIYTDLRFFERHFVGVMPLELMLDTKKPKGILQKRIDIGKLAYFQDSVLARFPQVAIPTSIIDPVKFAYQAASGGGGDSTYVLPALFTFYDLHKVLRDLQRKQQSGEMTASDTALQKLMGTLVDSSERYLRISAGMADIGTRKLPGLIDSIRQAADRVLNEREPGATADTAGARYHISVTGTSSTFLEGSRFIIRGLRESILYAFLLIAACMLYLFRSFRIMVCSLIPNLIPLLVTAGVMGWTGVPLKPSTVLVFSVALGIAIDITIRFLVNYRQELPANDFRVQKTVISSIRQTGLSIVYTSAVLIAGFVVFCFSRFGGTLALGWLTSLTLLVAAVTNLVLLPVLLLQTGRDKKIGQA